MAGVIERIAKELVVLHIPTGQYEDGKPKFDEVEGRAFVFESSENPVEYVGSYKKGDFGHIGAGVKMLVAPLAGDKKPRHPCKLEYGGKLYDLQGMRTVRNMKGVLLGYVIYVAGASS